MTEFQLQIVTPDGLLFDGMAEQLTVCTVDGFVGICAGHIDYVTALGMGEARVRIAGKQRSAACIGGMLSVAGGRVRLVATTFEWAEQIDRARADRAYDKAKAVLDAKTASECDLKLAEAKLKRALVRRSVAQ